MSIVISASGLGKIANLLRLWVSIEEFAAKPRPSEVYNMGGGRENRISMLEAIGPQGRSYYCASLL
jgi:hypothetical protein